MEDIIELLGWFTAIFVGLALANYVVKLINRKYINNLPQEKKNIKDNYRILMRYIVKYHKYFGIVAFISGSLHLGISIITDNIKITGLVTLFIMMLIFIIGIYGVYFKKGLKGKILKVHRILSIILILSIISHITL